MTGEELLAILNDELLSTSIESNYYYSGKRPVDIFQAPLDTVEDLKSIPSKNRYIGMTVTVLSGETLNANGKNIPDEYWLVGGTKNANWVKKPSVLDKKLSLSANTENATIELLYDGNPIGVAADLTDILSEWQNDQYIVSGSVVADGQDTYLELYYNDETIPPVRIDVSGLGGGGTIPVAGPQGPQGPAGNDGADGAEGAQGPQGNDGAEGAQGPQGNDGAEGAQGPQGPSKDFEVGGGLSFENDVLSVDDDYVKNIAISAITDSIIPSGASEALDTLEEIAEWIQSHPEEAANMAENIASISGAVETIQTSLSGITPGDENVIESVKVDGVELEVVDKSVDIVLSAYAKTDSVSSAITEALKPYATSAATVSAIKEASKPSLSANTYTDAKNLATSDNVGKIIEVKNEEDISGTTYSDGLYIVAGAGEISKLGVTSASGDIAGDIENIKGRVGTLESNVSNITKYLYWETDDDLEIE